MKPVLIAVVVTALCGTVAADEGMWTFGNVPRATIKEKYGVEITDAWLARLQAAVVRLEGGCSGSFVSPEGLILTNHHCAQSCIAENSTAVRDLVSDGFLAGTRDQEVRCQNEQVSVLTATEDVTAKVVEAVAGAPPADAAAARKQAMTRLEQACEEQAARAGTPLKCESVTLYQGGQQWLYKYKRYDDVRLVFAPEDAIAAFGGDPDNFQFPRWCLDMALLRAYENGKPAAPPAYLPFNWAGAEAGEATFVAGHPGRTDRLLTVTELRTQRDAFLPFWLIRFSELRGRLLQYSKSSPEAARTAQDLLDSIENSLKVRRMQQAALLDDALMERKRAEEEKLRAAVSADPALQASAGDAWDRIAKAQQVYRDILVPYVFLESAAGFSSDLFFSARTLLRAADERAKPNPERLREFTEAQLPQVKQALGAAVPVYPELEQARMSFALERMREWLGPDDPLIREVFGQETPDSLARELVTGSKLADPKVRLALFEGGRASMAASEDPMIRLARRVDERARALRTRYEREVEGPTERAHEAIAAARFKVYGTSLYPDATFTLRLSYGSVLGWIEKGKPVAPFTTFERLYARATGVPPFDLPARWLDARPRLDLATRANFVTSNDIIGGNSGSPMVNAKGEIVGLVFDGNIHSIAGSYWFDETMNRTVAVHPGFIRAALSRVSRADGLAKELGMAAGSGSN